jgi:hypothetical protein
MSREWSPRSQLYRDARVMGNLEVLSQGPVAYGRRYARRKAYARSNALTHSVLRSLGLSR